MIYFPIPSYLRFFRNSALSVHLFSKKKVMTVGSAVFISGLHWACSIVGFSFGSSLLRTQSRTMLRAAASRCTRAAARRLSSLAAEAEAVAASPAAAGARRKPSLYEGDWSYHTEWWGEEDGPGEGAQTVFRRHSECGNGVVSVSAYPASLPVVITSLSCFGYCLCSW